ncbi:hypothetical protein ACMD2_11209 [Ananas comosus]|uniref:AB hydrolase-1 domain-containing protein n=1 Tax=Ananas comosus TaxID=4615 RepID=A0A199UM94_ANACO|nr:hypothetical protein ACMD2_11209 [Ananas comosus]
MAARFLPLPHPPQPQPFSLSTCRRSSKKTKLPVPLPPAAAAAYELREGQSRHFHQLPSSGLALEVISHMAETTAASSKPPALVMVHGSFHAAWCWAEHWLPFFARAGFDCYALSLLAQGESDVPPGAVAGTLETHTSDIANFIREEISSPPVLIGHSFGGLIVQSYISNMRNKRSSDDRPSSADSLHPELAGAVLVCSVPPNGNSGLVWRYLLTKPVAAFKVTMSLAAKAFANSLSLCKETFFSPEMEDHLVLRYQELMKESSKLPLFDLKKLNASLPVPSIPRNSVDLLIMGASNDFIVDAEGLTETAKFYQVEPVCVEGLAHDLMLDYGWEKGAQIILSWLNNLHKDRAA